MEDLKTNEVAVGADLLSVTTDGITECVWPVIVSSFPAKFKSAVMDDFIASLDGDLEKDPKILANTTFFHDKLESGDSDDETTTETLYSAKCRDIEDRLDRCSSKLAMEAFLIEEPSIADVGCVDNFAAKKSISVGDCVVCLGGELDKTSMRLVVDSFFSDEAKCVDIGVGEGSLNDKVTVEAVLRVVSLSFSFSSELKGRDNVDCLGCLDEELGKNVTRLLTFNSEVICGDCKGSE